MAKKPKPRIETIVVYDRFMLNAIRIEIDAGDARPEDIADELKEWSAASNSPLACDCKLGAILGIDVACGNERYDRLLAHSSGVTVVLALAPTADDTVH